jgi:hypothetical protein
MTRPQQKESWLEHMRLEVPPEQVVRRLWASLSRICDRDDSGDERDAHLWAEGPLPGKLAGCLNCEEFRTQGRDQAATGLPRIPWHIPQRLFVLCGRRGPLH